MQLQRCIVSTKVGRQDKAGSSAAVDCSRVQWRTERGAPVQLQRRRCVAAATPAVHAVHCTVITINAGAAAAPAGHTFVALSCTVINVLSVLSHALARPVKCRRLQCGALCERLLHLQCCSALCQWLQELCCTEQEQC